MSGLPDRKWHICAMPCLGIAGSNIARPSTELNGFALDAVSAGDVVMIKSSKGTGCGRIVAALLDKYPAFSDTGPAK